MKPGDPMQNDCSRKDFASLFNNFVLDVKVLRWPVEQSC